MKVFISHSSKDKELVSSLVSLLQKAMRLSSDEILCSSLDGYKLPAGVSTNETLRIEVHESELLVGLITPNSLRSLYVAFELGARWGSDRQMIPLLASGVFPEHLEGPLAGINALRCDNDSQVNQLIEEASGHLGIRPERPSSLVNEVKDLVQLSNAPSILVDDLRIENPTSHLSPQEKEILLLATRNDEGEIHYTKYLSGASSITAGGIQVYEGSNKRSAAEWSSAIRNLESKGLTIDESGEGEYYEVTGEGYSEADHLRNQEIQAK